MQSLSVIQGDLIAQVRQRAERHARLARQDTRRHIRRGATQATTGGMGAERRYIAKEGIVQLTGGCPSPKTMEGEIDPGKGVELRRKARAT
eukprot:4332106-Pyramimonas_sp.AAC.1